MKVANATFIKQCVTLRGHARFHPKSSLNSKVRGLNVFIMQEIRRITFDYYFAVLNYITTIRDLKGVEDILFD